MFKKILIKFIDKKTTKIICKIFYNSSNAPMTFWNFDQKYMYLIFDWKKFSFIFYQTNEFCFSYIKYTFGVKLYPILKSKTNRPQNSIYLDIIVLFVLICLKKKKKKNFLFFLVAKFCSNCINFIQKVFKISIYSRTKKKNIIFEETADKLKFYFDRKFIQTFFLKNFSLEKCWLASKFFFIDFLKYWEIYIFSCYNSMTKYKKTEINRNENFKKFLFFSQLKLPDYEFFYIKKSNKKIQRTSVCFFKKEKSFLDKFNNIRNSDITRWRNRNSNKANCRKNLSRHFKIKIKIIY